MLEGLSGTLPVSELCLKYGISAADLFNWKEMLLKQSSIIFDNKSELIVDEIKENILRLNDLETKN